MFTANEQYRVRLEYIAVISKRYSCIQFFLANKWEKKNKPEREKRRRMLVPYPQSHQTCQHTTTTKF